MKKTGGWTGKILRVDLTNQKMEEIDTSQYSSRFLGGIGVAAKLYWDEVTTEVSAFSPENRLIFMTGPLAGTQVPAAPRWVVCSKAPMPVPEQYCYGNLGAYFGAELKSAGYDGLIIEGKADGPCYLWITDGKAEIKRAGHLWKLDTEQTRKVIHDELGKTVRIVTCGPAGENRVRIATLSTEIGGSASAGLGAVMGSKNLKAIAAKGSSKLKVAHPSTVKELREYMKKLLGENSLHPYRQFAPFGDSEPLKQSKCHGCPDGCWRGVYKSASGKQEVRKCQAMYYYTPWDRKLNNEVTEVSFTATSFANRYGLDTMQLSGIVKLLERSYQEGILNEKETNLPLNKIGSLEFIEMLIKKISSRKGFGNILAEGVLRAAEKIGKGALELTAPHMTKTGFSTAYGPKIFLITALFYATEPRPRVTELHEVCNLVLKWVYWATSNGESSYLSPQVGRAIARKFWGSELGFDFSTYEGKALAAMKIQNRQFAKECLVLCDFAWPYIDVEGTEDHIGDYDLEAKFLTAVTGMEIDGQGLEKVGERVFNLQRAIVMRERSKGREEDIVPENEYVATPLEITDLFSLLNSDLLMPGKDGETISRSMLPLDREGFEKMKDEYYELRGWDVATGLQKKEKLVELELEETIGPLEARGVLK
ncbi:MAG TPA: aldehyde ferredoxin oxidoreductase N-terminal domain-containing protein [Thermodesulfobacteriota bacterium]|nr:aldehyde ferredoxin oxidoreductase N-terminal domain-containing protein [Thermodesulfobacteriota bacterium]